MAAFRVSVNELILCEPFEVLPPWCRVNVTVPVSLNVKVPSDFDPARDRLKLLEPVSSLTNEPATETESALPMAAVPSGPNQGSWLALAAAPTPMGACGNQALALKRMRCSRFSICSWAQRLKRLAGLTACRPPRRSLRDRRMR